jgi:hypothetical protein
MNSCNTLLVVSDTHSVNALSSVSQRRPECSSVSLSCSYTYVNPPSSYSELSARQVSMGLSMSGLFRHERASATPAGHQ